RQVGALQAHDERAALDGDAAAQGVDAWVRPGEPGVQGQHEPDPLPGAQLLEVEPARRGRGGGGCVAGDGGALRPRGDAEAKVHRAVGDLVDGDVDGAVVRVGRRDAEPQPAAAVELDRDLTGGVLHEGQGVALDG